MRALRSRSTAFAAGGVLIIALLLSTRVTAQGQGNGVQERLSALESQVAALVAQVTALTARVTTLESVPARVTALEARATSLEARAGALENRTAASFNVSVDCGNGETIGGALAQTVSHTGTVRISVSGVCNESVVVSRARTIIQGAGPGATIQAPSFTSTAVRVGSSGGPFLALSNLRITGAQTGISVDNGAQVQVDGVTLVGNVSGISLNNRSGARLFNTTIDQPALPVSGGGVAVNVSSGAFVSILNSAIRNHNNYALQLQNGAVAEVGNTQISGIQNGGGPGSIRGAVGLYGGSTLRLNGGATITGNTGNGVFVAMGSVLYLENNVSITANTGHGISASDGAVVGKFFVTTAVQINDNGGYGISCSAPPGLGQLYGFPAGPNTGQPIVTSGNGLGGINATCHAAPVP